MKSVSLLLLLPSETPDLISNPLHQLTFDKIGKLALRKRSMLYSDTHLCFGARSVSTLKDTLENRTET